jgi:cardiolipin synthase (CMP-forming)
MTIPNLITILRILLAPVFVIYLINGHLTAALIIFVVCSVSDGVDGMVARFFNQKSRLGAYLDPLADKLLLVAAFIVLSAMGHLPAWLTVTVITRDVVILLGVVTIHFNKLELPIRPSVLSKINTCFQFLTVTVVLSKDLLSLAPPLYHYFYYATALFTVSSGLHYIQYGLKFLAAGEKGLP